MYQIDCGMKDKSSMFLSPEFKNLIFYVVFDAELNGTIRILCFHHAIIDLLWPSHTDFKGHFESDFPQAEVIQAPTFAPKKSVWMHEFQEYLLQ